MNIRKRTKWEPAALMVLVLGLGSWLESRSDPQSKPDFHLPPDSLTQKCRSVTHAERWRPFKQIGVPRGRVFLPTLDVRDRLQDASCTHSR